MDITAAQDFHRYCALAGTPAANDASRLFAARWPAHSPYEIAREMRDEYPALAPFATVLVALVERHRRQQSDEQL